jgi:hypothetical protein
MQTPDEETSFEYKEMGEESGCAKRHPGRHRARVCTFPENSSATAKSNWLTQKENN